MPFSAQFRHFRLPPCRPTVVPGYPLEAAASDGWQRQGALVTPRFRLGWVNSRPFTALPDHGGGEEGPLASYSLNRDESEDTGDCHGRFGVTLALHLLPFAFPVVADIASCRPLLDRVPSAGTRAVATIGHPA